MQTKMQALVNRQTELNKEIKKDNPEQPTTAQQAERDHLVKTGQADMPVPETDALSAVQVPVFVPEPVEIVGGGVVNEDAPNV